MLGRLHGGVGLLHPAVGTDQVADPPGAAGLGVVAGPVGEADLAVGVAQQREVVAELAGEGGVGLGGVEADAEDLDSLPRVVVLEVAEPATLLRSARGVGLGEEPQDDLLPPEVREPHGAAQVVLDREVGGDVAGLEHRA